MCGWRRLSLKRAAIRIEEYLSARWHAPVELDSVVARCTGCDAQPSLARAARTQEGDRTSYLCPDCGTLLVSLVTRERAGGEFDSLLEIPGTLTILESSSVSSAREAS